MKTYAITYETPEGSFRTLCSGLAAVQALAQQLQAQGSIVRDICIVS